LTGGVYGGEGLIMLKYVPVEEEAVGVFTATLLLPKGTVKRLELEQAVRAKRPAPA